MDVTGVAGLKKGPLGLGFPASVFVDSCLGGFYFSKSGVSSSGSPVLLWILETAQEEEPWPWDLSRYLAKPFLGVG